MAAHSSILAWKIPWIAEPGRLHPWGRKESDTTERLHFTLGFPSSSVIKNLPARQEGDLGSIPGLERSPGGGHSNPL